MVAIASLFVLKRRALPRRGGAASDFIRARPKAAPHNRAEPNAAHCLEQ